MKLKAITRLRTFIQIIAAIITNGYVEGWIFKPHLYVGNIKAILPPILNCYACPGAFPSCPMGSLQHYMVIQAFPYYIIGSMILFGAFIGRLFCAWACPFGLFQDILHKIPTRKFKMPRWFRFCKYAFLILTVFLLPFIISDTVFCKLCPDGALVGGIPQMLLNSELHHLAGTLFWTKIAILAVIIIVVILINRFFCRAVCPMGAFMAFFNKISLLQMVVDQQACDKCNMCKEVCPVDIAVYESPDSPECIRCGQCTSCPKGAVRFGTIFSKKRTTNADSPDFG